MSQQSRQIHIYDHITQKTKLFEVKPKRKHFKKKSRKPIPKQTANDTVKINYPSIHTFQISNLSESAQETLQYHQLVDYFYRELERKPNFVNFINCWNFSDPKKVNMMTLNNYALIQSWSKTSFEYYCYYVMDLKSNVIPHLRTGNNVFLDKSLDEYISLEYIYSEKNIIQSSPVAVMFFKDHSKPFFH